MSRPVPCATKVFQTLYVRRIHARPAELFRNVSRLRAAGLLPASSECMSRQGLKDAVDIMRPELCNSITSSRSSQMPM